MMRAARYYGPGAGLVLEAVPVPDLGPGEVLVRVLAAGVCHTELQFLAGTLNLGVTPLTLGHEVAGAVAALGEGVEDFRLGDRVLMYYYSPCGECDWCRNGKEQLCPNMGPQVGFTSDGGFAEYVRVPAPNLLPIPDGLDIDEAAPLGCAAASALHAVRAVAQVRAGETVLVYGIGAVGIALVQLARLAGARVIAVSRSTAKLTLARELEANVVINALEQDVIAEVLQGTRYEGVDVVFETVGSAETMANSIAMLRRSGRLVLVGYGEDRLDVNPLHLVLKELQIRGSLGNTREELRETLQLAASGQLHSIISHRLPLEEANGALTALQRGQIVGRAVLCPHRSEPIAPPAQMRPLEQELIDFIGRGMDASEDDEEFNSLALRLFAYQFEHNHPYRAFCLRRERTPDTVSHWRGIPPVPISAFKQAVLACEPVEGATEFNSSGTTQPERKSRHFHPNLTVYDLSATLNFQAHVLPDGMRLPMLTLFPPPEQMPNSSLAYWLALMVRHFGDTQSRWFAGLDGLDASALATVLDEAEQTGQPVCLLAASFALVHFLEHCNAHDLHFTLPPGSRLMDTGGYKGRTREVPKTELYEMVSDALHVEEDNIINMYGMTEHSTQYLDAVLRNRFHGVEAPRYKTVPPWARVLVLDPDTLEPVPKGQLGLLCHYDLANRASVMAVLSEDIGYQLDDGFELVGRANGIEARGCSITMDELVSVTRG